MNKTPLKINASLNDNLEVINAPQKPTLDVAKIYKKLDDDFVVCRMDAHDIHYVMSTWVLQEKWTPTQYTVEPFFAADNQGYYLLFVKGEPVASLAAVCYPAIKLAFIGLYLVDRERRQQSFGRVLWEAVVPDLVKEGYNLGLNASPLAVPADVNFYNKLGFKELYADEIWQRKKADIPKLVPASVYDIVPIAAGILDKVIDYDTHVFGQERKEFITDWIMKPETFSFAAFSQGDIAGYIVASPRVIPLAKNKKTYRLGPLFANGKLCASALLYNALLALQDAEEVMIDLAGNNITQSREVLEYFGFTLFFKSSHMYTEPPQTENDDLVYGKTSLTISHR
jgi:GNAT superfamily N-acetyltransferase